MGLVFEYTNIPWLPEGAKVRCVKDSISPPAQLVTGVFALCFQTDKLLFVRHRDRGWDLPGGHVEAGESFEVALQRELLEEAAAVISDVTLFAHIEINLIGEAPANYCYPAPQSFMLCFVAKIAKLEPFEAKFETVERKLCSPEEAEQMAWVKDNRALYEAVLKRDYLTP